MNKLLELRRKIKQRKPEFIRQDAHKKAKLKKKWVRPRGIDSKIRLGLKGYGKKPSSGWSSPKGTKGLTDEGLIPRIICTVKDIQDLNPEKEGIIISKTVGKKKKLEIIKSAKEKSIKILNIKDIEKYIKSVEEALALRKSKKKAIEKAKQEKKVEQAKKEEKKSEEKVDEDKKESEKKEKDKLLTKKEI